MAFTVQIGFSVTMLVFVIIFYASSPNSKLNQWCSIGGLFFWLGIVKQAIMIEIIPWMHSTFGMSGIDISFAPIHSIFTWAIYALALPTVTIGGLYFAYIDKEYPKYMRLLKPAMYFPGVILLFFFSPLRFREYQLNNQLFWIIYTIYNFSFAIALNALVARGVGIDKRSAIKNQKNQKKQAALILLPPLYYWLIRRRTILRQNSHDRGFCKFNQKRGGSYT